MGVESEVVVMVDGWGDQWRGEVVMGPLCLMLQGRRLGVRFLGLDVEGALLVGREYMFNAGKNGVLLEDVVDLC